MKNRLYINWGASCFDFILYNNINQQKNYQSTSSQIFDFNQTQVNSFLIKPNQQLLKFKELIILGTNNDSLVLKENILNTFFDKIFTLESETIMTKNQKNGLNII